MLKFFDRIFFDGDDGAGGGAGGTGEGGGAGDGGGEKKFTQADVDKAIQVRLSREKTKQQELAAELENIRNTAKLTADEKEKLSLRITELEEASMTAEQRASKARAAAEQQYKDALQVSKTEADTWKKRFQSSTIQRSLLDAAGSTKALNPQQIVMMFSSNVSLEEDMDEAGKPTGSFTPVLSFVGLDDKKKQANYVMPVVEALQKIKDDGLQANLFAHEGKPGTGTPPGKGGTAVDPKVMPRPEDYPSTEAWQLAFREWNAKRKEEKHGK